MNDKIYMIGINDQTKEFEMFIVDADADPEMVAGFVKRQVTVFIPNETTLGILKSETYQVLNSYDKVYYGCVFELRRTATRISNL